MFDVKIRAYFLVRMVMTDVCMMSIIFSKGPFFQMNNVIHALLYYQ